MTVETRMQGFIPRFTVADRARKAREHAGLEQGELAERMGVSRATISNLERGLVQKPRRIVLNAWAMATGVDRLWLETGKAPAEPGPEGLSYTTRDSNPEPAGLEFLGGARRNYTPILRFPRHGQAVAA